MKIAFIFPGQGAQFIGMGQDIACDCPAAAEIFERADKIVGYNLKKICFEGPEEKLNSTTISQPAIFTVSAAIFEAMRYKLSASMPIPAFTAGLSLGEYTALYAAGLISFEDALLLVQKRGQAMQSAADASHGSMVSIIGLDNDKVRQLCTEASQDELLVPANFNCPGQIVISGATDACRRAASLAEKYGAVKVVELKVAGAFHTQFMAPAARTLTEALDGCEIKEPGNIKVIVNVTAQYYNTARQVRQGLVSQLVMPILWEKCMNRLLQDGVELFYEIGPGRVLTALAKRIDRKARVINVSGREALQQL